MPLVIITALALAEQSGYFLDFFPYGEQDPEEVDWYARPGPVIPPAGVDIADYDLYRNGEDQEREPLPEDPHVVADRFADDLPLQLYSEAFLALLSHHFPPRYDLSSEEAQRIYINCLDYVEECLRQ